MIFLNPGGGSLTCQPSLPLPIVDDTRLVVRHSAAFPAYLDFNNSLSIIAANFQCSENELFHYAVLIHYCGFKQQAGMVSTHSFWP